jgi:hypothetical protein
MIKSRMMRWAGYVAHIGGEEEGIWEFGGKARRKGTTKKASTGGRII